MEVTIWRRVKGSGPLNVGWISKEAGLFADWLVM